MNCPSCNAENPEGARFCSECGTSMTPAQEAEAPGQEPTYIPPSDAMAPEQVSLYQSMDFAGFGPRLLAMVVDIVLITIMLIPLLFILVSLDLQINEIIAYPAYFIFLTVKKGQTFGKMLVGLKVVSYTGERPRLRQVVIRELYRFGLLLLAPVLAVIPLIAWLIIAVLIMGHVSVAFDPLKRGWHDRLSGTLVVRAPRIAFIQPPR